MDNHAKSYFNANLIGFFVLSTVLNAICESLLNFSLNQILALAVSQAQILICFKCCSISLVSVGFVKAGIGLDGTSAFCSSIVAGLLPEQQLAAASCLIPLMSGKICSRNSHCVPSALSWHLCWDCMFIKR
jgi:hypothetical protein